MEDSLQMAQVRRVYDWAGEYRRTLDAPDILNGDKVYRTVIRFDSQYMSDDANDDAVMAMPDPAKNAALSVTEVSEEVRREVQAGQNPEDNQWKSGKLDEAKRVLDAFLATDPDPAVQDAEMAGGKKRRRKTRKGKGKSRRARYSRRR